MSQMLLAMVVSKRPDDWNIDLPHVELLTSLNPVSAAAGLAPK